MKKNSVFSFMLSGMRNNSIMRLMQYSGPVCQIPFSLIMTKMFKTYPVVED